MKALIAALAALPLLLASGCSTPRASDSNIIASQRLSQQYGVVTAVSEVEAPKRSGIGAGAVIGGVVGGVLGNQVGEGRGNTLATIAGTVGGAVVGDKIQRNNEANRLAYRVEVRFENGNREAFILDDDDFRVGDRVVLSEGILRRR
ncbi:glycine zipper 2TM domain-containing protein [Chitinimonas lacunae]|uniref:Glycine zipper 2TM domain-containing protein n=1 Tax=Chitinimonas lacunae TaxID=1963018 RepID=A0ABV8MM50_9NEIS